MLNLNFTNTNSEEIKVGDEVVITSFSGRSRGLALVGKKYVVDEVKKNWFGTGVDGFSLKGENSFFWKRENLKLIKNKESENINTYINKKVEITAGTLKGLIGRVRHELSHKVIIILDFDTEVCVKKELVKIIANNKALRHIQKSVVVEGEYVNVEMYDNKTVVTLKGGSQGVSFCHPDDDFVEEYGIKVAYLKAKIAQTEKITKSLKDELKAFSA